MSETKVIEELIRS